MKTHTINFINRIQSGFLFLLMVILQNNLCFAQKEVPFTLDDRERLIRLTTQFEEFGNRLIRVETKVEGLENQISESKKDSKNQISELKEDTKYQISELTKDTKYQISELTKDTKNRFNELQADLRWMIGIFISSIFILVGFILWDRRTFLKPFESRAVELESEVKNIKSILSAFRELAKMDNKVAQVLRQYNLL